MRKISILALILAVSICSLSAIPGVSASPTNEYLRDGDFSIYDTVSMSANGYSNLTIWTDESTTGHARIVNSTYCQSIGFADECLEMYSPNTGSDFAKFKTNSFIWSNSSNGNMTFYLFHPSYQPSKTQGVFIELWNFTGATYQNVFQLNYNNLDNLSVWKIQSNMSAFLVNGQTYYFQIDMNGVIGDKFVFLDNMSLGNSQITWTTLTRECVYNNPMSFNFPNTVLTCPTSYVDTSSCDIVQNPRGSIDLLLNSSSFNYAFSRYIFNTSLTEFEYDDQGNGSTYYLYHEPTDTQESLTDYQNTNNAFATCDWIYNASTNATLILMDCRFSIDCGVFSENLVNCTQICRDGIIYHNGVLNATSGLCQDFTSQEYCGNGYCYSPYECAGVPFYYNESASPFNIDLNTTSVVAGQVLGLFTNNVGFAFIIFFIIEIGFYYMTNEFFTIILFSVINFIYGLIGFYPSWVAYLLSLLGFGLVALNFNHFKGGAEKS